MREHTRRRPGPAGRPPPPAELAERKRQLCVCPPPDPHSGRAYRGFRGKPRRGLERARNRARRTRAKTIFRCKQIEVHELLATIGGAEPTIVPCIHGPV